MMKTRLFLAPAVVLSAAVLVAGCGGGGGGGTTTLSKEEYADRLDAICVETNEAGKSLDLSSIAKIAASGDKAKDLLDKMANRIQTLQPPDELKDSANSFVDGLKQEAAKFGELTQAAKAGDAAKIQQIQGDLSSAAAATSEDARFLGATGCAMLLS